jgi:3-methylfumaryl-CoA hydratase
MTYRRKGSDVADHIASELEKYIVDWSPQAVTTQDSMDPDKARLLASTLDLADEFTDGNALPLMWQWLYFANWVPTAGLGEDGHPSTGPQLPPIPKRRRMFAGGRVEVRVPLTLGQPAERRSEAMRVTAKTGRTGELLFVTIRHEYQQAGSVALVEEQDLVYRTDTGAAPSFTRSSEPLGESQAQWTARPVTHPPLLFRFSALTSNAHRIHYDSDYAINTEGFPGLVVHGPLLAVYMSELLRANTVGRSVGKFEFRLSKPVFVGDPIEVQATRDGDGIALAVVSAAAAVHASAHASLTP